MSRQVAPNGIPCAEVQGWRQAPSAGSGEEGLLSCIYIFLKATVCSAMLWHQSWGRSNPPYQRNCSRRPVETTSPAICLLNSGRKGTDKLAGHSLHQLFFWKGAHAAGHAGWSHLPGQSQLAQNTQWPFLVGGSTTWFYRGYSKGNTYLYFGRCSTVLTPA